MSGSIFNPIFYSFKNNTLEFLKRSKRLQITLVSKVPRLYEQHKTMLKYQPYFLFSPNFVTLRPSWPSQFIFRFNLELTDRVWPCSTIACSLINSIRLKLLISRVSSISEFCRLLALFCNMGLLPEFGLGFKAILMNNNSDYQLLFQRVG